jgi:hypothetical protein
MIINYYRSLYKQPLTVCPSRESTVNTLSPGRLDTCIHIHTYAPRGPVGAGICMQRLLVALLVLQRLHRLHGQSLNVMVYDTSGESENVILYKSLRDLHVKFQVGSLAERAGMPYRGYPDRVPWLTKNLPRAAPASEDNVVLHVDARDAICLCGSDEILAKRAALVGATDAERTVIIGAEALLWPDEGAHYAAYGQESLAHAYRSTLGGQSDTPLRYINTGLLAAKPTTLLDLFACMKQRFASFPHACPRRLLSDGFVAAEYSDKLQYNFSKSKWHGPLKLRGGWGWDQACFHAYYLDQHRGKLSASCPRLVLDTRAELVLNVGQQTGAMRWHDRRGRIQYNRTGAWPCFVHAGGPFKQVLHKFKRWWRTESPEASRDSKHPERGSATKRSLPKVYRRPQSEQQPNHESTSLSR